jgi:hypothetical protein
MTDPSDTVNADRNAGRWKAWAIPLAFWALGPLLGLAFHCQTSLAPHKESSFFEVCALIEPVIGLAVFVELVVVLGQVVSAQGATPANQELARAVVRSNAGLLIGSGSAALYAIATESSSVFLLFATVVPMIVQVFLMVDCAYQRVGISRIRGG